MKSLPSSQQSTRLRNRPQEDRPRSLDNRSPQDRRQDKRSSLPVTLPW